MQMTREFCGPGSTTGCFQQVCTAVVSVVQLLSCCCISLYPLAQSQAGPAAAYPFHGGGKAARGCRSHDSWSCARTALPESRH